MQKILDHFKVGRLLHFVLTENQDFQEKGINIFYVMTNQGEFIALESAVRNAEYESVGILVQQYYPRSEREFLAGCAEKDLTDSYAHVDHKYYCVFHIP